MDKPSEHAAPESAGGSPWEVAWIFLRLGLTAFGGPAVHTGIMLEEFVRRRRWVSEELFLRMMGATNFIPGPNSTELSMMIGRRRAGWAGFFAAGLAFILPAAAITAALGWISVHWGGVPKADRFLEIVRPAVVAVLANACLQLSRAALSRWLGVALATASVLLALSGVYELWILAGAAFFGVVAQLGKRGTVAPGPDVLLPLPLLLSGPVSKPAAAAAFSQWELFLAFAKVGSILFGSGYVLAAFLETEFVQHLQWLTQEQLLDAVAAGQLTPGPLFTTATFVGFQLGGWTGAAVATAGIFAPAFFFAAMGELLLARMERSALLRTMIEFVVAASVGIWLSVLIGFAPFVIASEWSAAAFVAAIVGANAFRAGPMAILGAAAALGFLYAKFG